MQKELGKEFIDPEQRIRFLKDNCDKIEERGYMKRFTPDKIQEMKEALAETSIEINDIDVEKKAVMADFKVRLESLAEQRKELLKGIKNKAEFTTENCYKFVEMEEKMVGYYNGEGDLIDARPAMGDELQGTIFQIGRKTVTND